MTQACIPQPFDEWLNEVTGLNWRPLLPLYRQWKMSQTLLGPICAVTPDPISPQHPRPRDLYYLDESAPVVKSWVNQYLAAGNRLEYCPPMSEHPPERPFNLPFKSIFDDNSFSMKKPVVQKPAEKVVVQGGKPWVVVRLKAYLPIGFKISGTRVDFIGTCGFTGELSLQSLTSNYRLTNLHKKAKKTIATLLYDTLSNITHSDFFSSITLSNNGFRQKFTIKLSASASGELEGELHPLAKVNSSYQGWKISGDIGFKIKGRLIPKDHGSSPPITVPLPTPVEQELKLTSDLLSYVGQNISASNPGGFMLIFSVPLIALAGVLST